MEIRVLALRKKKKRNAKSEQKLCFFVIGNAFFKRYTMGMFFAVFTEIQLGDRKQSALMDSIFLAENVKLKFF